MKRGESLWRNAEGYADPTAGAAMSKMMKEYRKKRRKMFGERQRRRVYIASPYAGNVRENIKNARRFCRQAVEEGCIPFAPHLLFPQFLNDADEEERSLGLQFGLVFLRFCDELWVFGAPTAGMQAEINEAARLGLVIRER